MRRTLIAALVVSLAALAVPAAGTSIAKPATAARERGASSDVRQVPADVRAPIKLGGGQALTQNAKIRRGEVRTWLGLDDVAGAFYTKNYQLRGVGEHIEVWTATGNRKFNGVQSSNLNFQADDCRNGDRTKITQDQVEYFIDQFDNTIHPIESEVFSTPPDRDGSDAPATEALGLPADYYAGDGDDIVVLIDNVRDDNFYDLNNTQEFSYIAGFFSSGLNGFFNRNVMSIDGFDWLHRTGLNPPNDPVPGDPCASAPARPALYEGVFAHEYQHLLLSYVDPPEVTWINEGLADIAIALTGYGDPAAPITDVHFDSHIQCFLGNNAVQTDANPNPRPGGPENSLNVWGDQNFDHEQEILCDYGAAYSYLLWLGDTYGEEVYTTLHNDADNQGFDAIQAVLDEVDPGVTVSETIDIWQATVALDAQLDGGATLNGGDAETYTVERLQAAINWETGAPENDAYDTPGAPPNGGDFVRLMGDGGVFLSAGDVTSVEFQGVSALPPLPKTWTVDDAPPSGADGPALHSPVGDNLNEVIVRTVDIPAGSPALTFDAAWDLEATFDFGYAQITTDGGETYTSLGCSDTVDDTDPALGNVGPGFGQGFNGENDPPVFAPQTCDLSAFAGMTNVGLAFRVFNDGGVHFDGFWVDNVAIDGITVSEGDDLDAWMSATEFNPVEVESYTVQLVAYDSAGGGTAYLFNLPLDATFHGTLEGAAVAEAIGTSADVVAAIVTYHDGTQLVTQYAPYTLSVNGVTQPGGGEAAAA
ncbi:MAG TPA: peptidase M6 [Actinomycetota bacterium]|nr:peptidase M6 [Actinomycetota bacterium]